MLSVSQQVILDYSFRDWHAHSVGPGVVRPKTPKHALATYSYVPALVHLRICLTIDLVS